MGSEASADGRVTRAAAVTPSGGPVNQRHTGGGGWNIPAPFVSGIAARCLGRIMFRRARMAKYGKRDGLKSHCPKGLAGSSPAPGTERRLVLWTNKCVHQPNVIAAGH
jgi:hypothetical protein